MNFAVIASGGKQYKVSEGCVFDVEKLPADIGESIVLEKVLLAKIGESTQIGKPYLKSVIVKATVQNVYRDAKIRIIKFKRRKHQLKRQGHRQTYTTLKVETIEVV